MQRQGSPRCCPSREGFRRFARFTRQAAATHQHRRAGVACHSVVNQNDGRPSASHAPLAFQPVKSPFQRCQCRPLQVMPSAPQVRAAQLHSPPPSAPPVGQAPPPEPRMLHPGQSSSACSSASRTSLVLGDEETCQPTMCRAKTSMMKATYTNPTEVRT